MAIKNKKLLYILIPILVASTMIGCSNKSIEDTNTNNQHVETNNTNKTDEESKYSQEFKENFLKVANHYNNMEEFKERYNPIKWDETNNKPILADSMNITKYTDDEIIIDITNELNDKDVEFLQATNKLIELSKKIEPLLISNEDYSKSEEYKEFENFQEKYEKLSYEYYEIATKEKEDQKITDNTTVLTKCLVYSMIGGGEKVNDTINSYFSMLRLLSLMAQPGLIDDERTNILLNNIYIHSEDSDNIYGRLSFNRDINVDNRKITITFGFKKYTPSMDKEMKELQTKLEKLEKDLESQFNDDSVDAGELTFSN